MAQNPDFFITRILVLCFTIRVILIKIYQCYLRKHQQTLQNGLKL